MTDKSIDTFVEKRDEVKYAENQKIARRLRESQSRVKSLEEQSEASKAEYEEAQRLLSLYEKDYSRRPEWTKKAKKANPSAATAIFEFSDQHYGEVVRPQEMGDFNAYNKKIANLRTQKFFQNAIAVARDYATGIKYDGCVLAIPGDIITGEIHDELSRTNDMTRDESIMWAVPRIATGIEMFRKEFKNVDVVPAPGNHGRDSKQPVYKNRSARNADTMIMRLVADQFTHVPGVTFKISEALDSTFDVYGWYFAVEHGDELAKNFSGSAEIGWLGPLIRGTNRKINQYTAEGKKLHYVCWGHGHQLLPLSARGALANGSLKGYDEFARGKKFRPEPPQQAFLLLDAEHGVTWNAPIFVADRRAEGW